MAIPSCGSRMIFFFCIRRSTVEMLNMIVNEFWLHLIGFFLFVMKMIFYQLFFLSFFLTCCGQHNTRNKNAIFGVPERFPSDSLPKELEMAVIFLGNRMK